jgi:hypothetical protein
MQQFLDRVLDQGLHRHAAQDSGKFKLAVFCFGMRAPSWILASALRDGKSAREGAGGGRLRPGLAWDFGAAGMVSLLVFLVAMSIPNIVY